MTPLLPILLSLAAAAPVQETPTPDLDARFLSASIEVDGHSYGYRLLPPEELGEPGTRHPLILFLHGAGERGDDNTKQLTHFPRRMATDERRASMPCYVLAPQCPEDERWTLDSWGSTESRALDPQPTRAMRAAIAALREVVRDHPIDLQRVSLTGLSMGGYGTFELALRHPDWFSAVAPVCGGGHEEDADRLVGVPISVWHGADDRVVPAVRSRRFVEALRALGEEVEYRELPGVGHDAWNHAYADGGCVPWLLAQRRDPERRLARALALLAPVVRADDRLAFIGSGRVAEADRPGGPLALLRDGLARVRPGVKLRAVGADDPGGLADRCVAELLGWHATAVASLFEGALSDEGPALVKEVLDPGDLLPRIEPQLARPTERLAPTDSEGSWASVGSAREVATEIARATWRALRTR